MSGASGFLCHCILFVVFRLCQGRSILSHRSVATATFSAFFFTIPLTYAIKTKDVVIIIQSQANDHHIRLAETLRNDIISQALQSSLENQVPVVHLMHQDFPEQGSWTIIPMIEKLYHLHGHNSSWIFFCQDRNAVNLHILINTLSKYNASLPLFLGHPLRDAEPTIIHHFAFFDDSSNFTYPDFSSGFAISTALLEKSAVELHVPDRLSDSEFSIDAQHELAVFFWNNGRGTRLTEVPEFNSGHCQNNSALCAVAYQPIQTCDNPVPSSQLLFAVKTCQKFHKDRIPVVQSTWAKHITNIEYYSDKHESSIPTIASSEVPNSDRGHCLKTQYILKRTAGRRDLNQIQWLVIVDDDTILSTSRLRELLSCYDPSQPVVLGERYGFRVAQNRGDLSSYNYVTGGGGIVLSLTAVKAITSALDDYCRCPSRETPDDMFLLGFCLARTHIPIIHCPLFHQARPVDYSHTYLLRYGQPVSFHKHWMVDPNKIYAEWFQAADRVTSGNSQEREEL